MRNSSRLIRVGANSFARHSQTRWFDPVFVIGAANFGGTEVALEVDDGEVAVGVDQIFIS